MTTFFTTFRQLSDVLLHLANQNARTVRGGVAKCRKANTALDNSTSLSSCKLLQRCHKVFKNYSKTLLAGQFDAFDCP